MEGGEGEGKGGGGGGGGGGEGEGKGGRPTWFLGAASRWKRWNHNTVTTHLHHQERKRCPHCLGWGAGTEQRSPPQPPSADETLPSLRLSLLQKTC